jgi:hypothetical protein
VTKKKTSSTAPAQRRPHAHRCRHTNEWEHLRHRPRPPPQQPHHHHHTRRHRQVTGSTRERRGED